MFDLLMRQIDFDWPLSHGAVLNKAKCWKSLLEETKDAIYGGDDFTQDEKDNAMKSIDSLSSRITAKKPLKKPPPLSATIMRSVCGLLYVSA